MLEFFGAELTIWGNPASPIHDEERGACYLGLSFDEKANPKCPAGVAERPFVTLPRACNGPLATNYATDSWQDPGRFLANGEPDLSDPNWVTGSALTHDASTPPNPRGFKACERLGFDPTIMAEPTSRAASSPSGLDFSLEVGDPGLTSPAGIADSDIRKAVVTLPEGMSANPSLAEGLSVCTEANLAGETSCSEARGLAVPTPRRSARWKWKRRCWNEKRQRLAVHRQALREPLRLPAGDVHGDQEPDLGIKVKQAARGRTRPGHRPADHRGRRPAPAALQPLPPALPRGRAQPAGDPGQPAAPTTSKPCSTPGRVARRSTTTSAFQIISGPNGGPCPKGGLPPFKPGLMAGTINNRAGSFSPFNLRMFRTRLRTGDHPLLDQAAAGDHRQAGRHPLLPRRGDRRRQGQDRPPRRPGRARQPHPAPRQAR